MAQQRQDRRGEVQAATASATGLACFIFRFLRCPPCGQNGCLTFHVKFVNDWTGTVYTFDAGAYWPVDGSQNLYQYLEEQLGLLPENQSQSK